MDMPVLTCVHCGARLKVKPATLRFIKEIPCAKCRKKFTVTDEMKAQATVAATAPAASVPPPAGQAAPASPTDTPAAAAPPATPTAASPAPAAPAVPAAPAAPAPAAAPTAPTAPVAPATVSPEVTAKVEALEKRVAVLEATITALRGALK